MARPTPIIVPGPSGMGSQQTDVGVDLSRILGFFKEKKEAEEAKTREESITNFLVEQLVPPTPRAVGGGVSTIPGLNIPQQAEVGATPQQRSFIQSLVGQDPAKATELARGMAFPGAEVPTDFSGAFAKINPEKFTPESLGTFQTTGDISALDLKKEFFPSAGDTFANESSLRKEFEAQPLIKDQVLLSGQVARMDEALSEAEAQEGKEADASFIAVDQAIITIFNKMLDPTSVVRESEYARSAEDQGLVSRGRSLISRIQAGGRLNPVERKAIVDMARRFMDVHDKRFKANADKFRGIAERNKLNPEDVVIEAGKEPAESEDQFEILEVR